MSENKTYFYMRLKENYFDGAKIKYLKSLPDGYHYSDLLLQMYLLSLKDDGQLMYTSTLPYTPKILATVTGHKPSRVQKALELFEELELIDVLENGCIYMLDIQALVGKSSTEGERKKRYRKQIESEKALLEMYCMSPAGSC